jgi:hypothetical protein
MSQMMEERRERVFDLGELLLVVVVLLVLLLLFEVVIFISWRFLMMIMCAIKYIVKSYLCYFC